MNDCKTIYSDNNNELIYFPTEDRKRILFIHGDSATDYYLDDKYLYEYDGKYELIHHIINRIGHNPCLCAYIVNEILKLK